MHCAGLTLNKTRCRKKVTIFDKFCHIHKNQHINNSSDEKTIPPLLINTSTFINTKSDQNSSENTVITNKDHKKDIDIIVDNNNDNTSIKEAYAGKYQTISTDNTCSICLCDVDKETDSELVCGHKHHTECINQSLKSCCPVCIQPLRSLKENGINIVQIITNEEIEAQKQVNESLETDREFANYLAQNLPISLNQGHYPFGINDDSSSDRQIYVNISSNSLRNNLINAAIQSNLITNQLERDDVQPLYSEHNITHHNEVDDYEFLATIIENSYYAAKEKEDEILQKIIGEIDDLDKALRMSLPLFTYLDQYVFKGEKSVTIKLNVSS